MKAEILRRTRLILLVFLCWPAWSAVGQHHHHHHSHEMWRLPVANVIMPQARPVNSWRPAAVRITQVEAAVTIQHQVATTVLDIHLQNPANQSQEAELLVPVPDGAVIRGFDFSGSASEPTAVLLPKEEARRTYRDIVARVKDPALLEFIGWNLVRSSVFPVQANGTQQVRLTYENVLTATGQRVDYVLPRSESVDYLAPWSVTINVQSKTPIAAVYSPSHELDIISQKERAVKARLAKGAGTVPGPFHLSYLTRDKGLSATLFAYPDPKAGGGYFLLLAGLEPRPADAPVIAREVTVVVDRSGSMAGEKLEQVIRATRQVIAGLNDGERFNIIVYNEGVDLFANAPVKKTRQRQQEAFKWLESVTARGGTNVHDALVEALKSRPAPGTLPIVLFLTDGLPTIGQTSEKVIRETALVGNKHKRRIFTFGVGVDVNTPLLTALASESRALSTFVLPKEDVELKMARVFNALSGPILADTALGVIDKDRQVTPARIREVLPRRLPDLFEGDQLVVLGQWLGDEPLSFVLSGNFLGKQRDFTFTFDLEEATTRNAFVPRLWAARKIAVLVDAIRQSGADAVFNTDIGRIAADPRFKELVDEIVRLSTEFGILTEYTAFLAREGVDLGLQPLVNEQAARNFLDKAVRIRSGLGSVSQSMNNDFQSRQQNLNPRNRYFDADMNPVEVNTVQQVSDRAFYRRGNTWVDSTISRKGKQAKPRRVVNFGSDEFCDMAIRLAREGRQGSVSLRGQVMLEVDGEAVMMNIE